MVIYEGSKDSVPVSIEGNVYHLNLLYYLHFCRLVYYIYSFTLTGDVQTSDTFAIFTYCSPNRSFIMHNLLPRLPDKECQPINYVKNSVHSLLLSCTPLPRSDVFHLMRNTNNNGVIIIVV